MGKRQYPRLSTGQKKELGTIIHGGEHSAREVKHAQCVLLLNRDTEIREITELTGLERSQIFKVRRDYLEHGVKGIRDKRQGKPKEILTKKQREEVVQIIKTKRPSGLDPYYQNYDYWTTGVLGEYIKRTYDVEYKSKTSHYILFRQAKFTYHKPGRIYHEQRPEEIEQWKKDTESKLKTLWQEPDTIILAEDEMILTTETTIQKIWLPQGEYPRIEVSNTHRQRRNLYGFLNIRTGTQHVFKTMKQNMIITTDILKKVRKIYPKQKIVLFWDSAGWHKGSAVREYIEQDGSIESIHFPRYAPELNPQEHVWKSGRSRASHNRFIEDIDKATDEFVHYLNTMRFPYSLIGFSPSS
jgi:transposase